MFGIPSIKSIIGFLLVAIGAFLFFDLAIVVSLNPSDFQLIQIMPMIGGVILGIGLGLIIMEKQLIMTGLASLVFLVLAIKNPISLGFAFGIWVPAMSNFGKSLHVHLAAVMLFMGIFLQVSASPDTYRAQLVDSLAELTTQNAEAMTQALGKQAEAMIPTKDQLESLGMAIFPCENQTQELAEKCVQARERFVNQMYQEMHSPEYKQRIMQEMKKQYAGINKDFIKETINTMPITKLVLDNIALVYAFIYASIWLAYASLFVLIPQGVVFFAYKLLGKG